MDVFEDLSLDGLGCVGDPWPEYPWLTEEEIEAEYHAMEQGCGLDEVAQQA